MSATALVRERCWTHPVREAAARCPSCHHFFCRECVTEHHGKLLCAGCLREQTAATARRPGRLRQHALTLGRTCLLTLSILSAWFFFHLLAQTLITMPSEFHAGTLWRQLGVPPGPDDE